MPKPPPADVWRAIELYLDLAYDAGPPGPVRAKLDALRQAQEGDFFASGSFERKPEAPNRYALRLGNRYYPHMKLVIERRPDGRGYLFRADTHDQHCCPPEGSKEYPIFCTLMEQNQNLAQQIEAAWDQSHIPTFKSYLREDLVRRRGSSAAPTARRPDDNK